MAETGIETYNRQKVENIGSEQKSRRIKKEMKALKKRYSKIGDNQYFISHWGYTLEFQ